MNPYSILPLLSALAFILLGFIVFLKSKEMFSVRIAFILNCLTSFWWQFTWFILFNIKNETLASYLVRIGYSGIIFIPVTFFHFYTSYLDLKENKKWVNFYYFIGFVFLILLWTTTTYIKGYYTYFWGYYPKAGFLHPVYLIYLIIIAIHCFSSLISFGRKIDWSGIKGNQIKYLITALSIYCFASSDFIVNYGIEFYPLGVLAILVSLGITTYAILKHRLLDITIALTRAGIFAFVYLLILVIPYY